MLKTSLSICAVSRSCYNIIMDRETHLKLSKNETKQLVDSLRNAHMQGFRTPEEFLHFLDGQSGYYLIIAREKERKSKNPNNAILMRRQYCRIAKNCRRVARIVRRLHTKIMEYRNL